MGYNYERIPKTYQYCDSAPTHYIRAGRILGWLLVREKGYVCKKHLKNILRKFGYEQYMVED